LIRRVRLTGEDLMLLLEVPTAAMMAVPAEAGQNAPVAAAEGVPECQLGAFCSRIATPSSPASRS